MRTVSNQYAFRNSILPSSVHSDAIRTATKTLDENKKRISTSTYLVHRSERMIGIMEKSVERTRNQTALLDEVTGDVDEVGQKAARYIRQVVPIERASPPTGAGGTPC